MPVSKKKTETGRMMRAAHVLIAAMACAPAMAQVYRCGNSYQATPCAGGKQIEATTPVTAGESETQTIYLCKSYQGGGYWSSKHCNHRSPPAILERMVTVPAHWEWDDKVRYASGERRAAESLQRAPARAAAPAAQGSGRSSCEGYSQALRTNESQARAGGTAAWMEYLAEERRRIQREQSAAGCS